jgi:hypothetical protein
MTTEKTNKWSWDKPVFPSENLASELDTLISQIDSEVGNLPPYINDLQIGEGGNRDYHYESTNPAGFALSPGQKQNSNSYSRIEVENNTDAEVTEQVTQTRYIGTDNTGTVDFTISKTLTISANESQFWYPGDGNRLPEDTYFWEVTSSNGTFDIVDARLYFNNYFHEWELTNGGNVKFSTTKNSGSQRDIVELDGKSGKMLFSGDNERGINVSADKLAYSDMLRVQNTGSDFTIVEIESPEKDGKEATLSLTRHEPDGTPHFLDIFNNGYSSSKTFGFRMQTRDGGTLKPFKFQFNDGVEEIYDRLNVPPKGSPVEVMEGFSLTGGEITNFSEFSDHTAASVNSLYYHTTDGFTYKRPDGSTEFLAGEGSSGTASVTANYTAKSGEVVLADASGGPITITTPAASDDVTLTVKKIDSTGNDVTIVTPGTETVDGESEAVVASQYTSISLVANGGNYWIV